MAEQVSPPEDEEFSRCQMKGGSRKRPDQPCSSSSLQSKRLRENNGIDVPMSSDHIEQTPSVSSLVASPGPSSDPFTPDIKSQNVTPHSTIDEMKSPTPMTSGQKLEVSDFKSTLETTDQKLVLTSPTQPGPPSNTTISESSPATLPRAPSLTSPPLTTPGEPTQPVSVPPVLTPVEKGAPSTMVVPNPQLKKEFTREELEAILLPIFTLIWKHPEAYPFHKPINPQRLGIPDYFNIVKYPMDLGTIDKKLVNGEYKNPWEFCNDMLLMFNNAWLYNKKTSKVYKMCTKLYKVFSEHVDSAMKSFGYCCGCKNLALSQTGKQGTEESLATGLPVSIPGGQTNSAGGHDQQETKLIQQQLVLLLHANKCLQREGENPSHVCNLQYCRTMKNVLGHMMKCQESNNCSYAHCMSSRQIIMHWKQCGCHYCSICTPVKGITPGSVPDGSLATGPQGGDAWQSSIQQNLRDHLIRRMLHGIYPVQNIEAMRQNMQYMKLVAYFKKMEEDFFNSCRSKEEYFSKLAEKYRHVQAEINRTPRPVPAGPHSMIPPQSHPPFNHETANFSAGSCPSSSTMMDSNSSMPMSSDYIKHVQSVLSLVASPQPISDTITPDIKKPVLTSPTQPGPPFNTTIINSSPSTLSRAPSLTSPPLNTPGEPTQPVSVAPISTPVEKGAPSTKVVPNPQLKKEFTREELEAGLRPIFTLVWEQPEAYPFHEPVNPQKQGIPDYFNIVKHPMDLGTIDRKLVNGEYKNPWEFCNDMLLMFNNAWLYNKETSKVYKMCTKLYEVFSEHVDSTMKSFGYCCGSRYSFSPQVLYCFSKTHCPIPRDASYYSCENRYVYCLKCFIEIPGDTVSPGDDPSTSAVIEKSKFVEMKNSHIESEPTVDCFHCGRTFHKVCVLWHESIWPEGYQCDICLRTLGTTRKDNKYCAEKLPSSQLSSHLEDRVNNFLRQVAAGAEITIRVVSSTEKVLDTKPEMREMFPDFPEKLPYNTKAMLAFEELDGVDVCFFGMVVQEYSSECPPPNKSRVYISYLDRVHFFQPKEYRTLVYHEILIGYLDFVKNLGYETAHIWTCPPSEGDDYIFHCPEQKIPKPKRLQEWYYSMLERAKQTSVIQEFYDIYQYYEDQHMTSVQGLPYFEGDFWPNVIEEQIKELKLEEERMATIANEEESQTLSSKQSSEKACEKAGDLSQRLLSIMERHKEVFIVVRLNPEGSLFKTTDPDPLVTYDLMERDAFRTMAREKHWEFSSLRRAKYSTLAMLVQLHNNRNDRFIYHCNRCEKPIESRYTCTEECEDFNLCEPCYERYGHKHQMKKVRLGLVEVEHSRDKVDQREFVKHAVQHTIEVLVHASRCNDRNCKNRSCIKMKQVILHVRRCRTCPICKQFVQLCLQHAKQCKVKECTVPLCANLKKRIEERQRESQINHNRLMRVMRSDSSPSITPDNTVAQSPAPNTPHPQ